MGTILSEEYGTTTSTTSTTAAIAKCRPILELEYLHVIDYAKSEHLRIPTTIVGLAAATATTIWIYTYHQSRNHP